MPRQPRVAHHLDTAAARLRQLKMLSPFNEKTPKGEALGYLTAILYLAPHTLGGGATLCPHSTEACRAACLYSAGRGRTPRVERARLRRTGLWLNDRDRFFDELVGDLVHVQRVARSEGLVMAIRLNGTSDILWERETLDGKTLFDLFPDAVFYDYTRVPLRHRHVPPNWRLTYSLADAPIRTGLEYLRSGRNIAVVVPEAVQERLAGTWVSISDDATAEFINGDEHDLRFLDPSPAIVLLRPKGRARRGGAMVRPTIFQDLIQARRTM